MTFDVVFSKEVATARAAGHPIVALESTIITHGMPFPQNIEMANAVEDLIRGEGATPATIAVLNGTLHIGLELAGFETLAHAPNPAKLSRADLAAALAQKWTGATTVAATMIAAHHVGISVFATGGIGGVHKGAEDTFDISADLQELAKTPVTVVCAGAKAILDIPKTLEVLETLGVPVITFGQNDFPAFWSASSGVKSPLRMDSPLDIANAMKVRSDLDLPGGHLIANPIPATFDIPAERVAPWIALADGEARAQGIEGKKVTPFLLQRVFELSEGTSLKANIELVKNNASLAAKIAISANTLD